MPRENVICLPKARFFPMVESPQIDLDRKVTQGELYCLLNGYHVNLVVHKATDPVSTVFNLFELDM